MNAAIPRSVVSPPGATFDSIRDYVRELEGRGIRLVPASVALRGAKAVRVTKAD